MPLTPPAVRLARERVVTRPGCNALVQCRAAPLLLGFQLLQVEMPFSSKRQPQGRTEALEGVLPSQYTASLSSGSAQSQEFAAGAIITSVCPALCRQSECWHFQSCVDNARGTFLPAFDKCFEQSGFLESHPAIFTAAKSGALPRAGEQGILCNYHRPTFTE